MNEKNIEWLKARLVGLGFEPSVEAVLRCNICFSPVRFELPLERHAGPDLCRFQVEVEKKDDGVYDLSCYTATLRKAITVPAELKVLDQRMSGIDWNLVVAGRSRPISIDKVVTAGVFEILQEIDRMGSAATLLKYKHWAGTTLETTGLFSGNFKSNFEIAERFYFLSDNELITFSEAIRFLNSRWLERQVLARRRLLLKDVDEDKQDSRGEGGGKLLKKRPKERRQRVTK